MTFENEITAELKNRGADFVSFVDISQLSDHQNRQYPNAIILGIALSPSYLQKVSNTPNYVQEMIQNKEVYKDEFHLKEIEADRLADFLAEYLTRKGFSSYSQSEDNLYSSGFYDKKTKGTPLPHKTIAGLAGLGWIGKHNLLVTPEYGSAVCMCTVLTDAPFKTALFPPESPKCNDCTVCQETCAVQAIKGNLWKINTSRDNLIDVNKCTPCLQCMVQCPWTQGYAYKME